LKKHHPWRPWQAPVVAFYFPFTMSVEQGELHKDKESENFGVQAETRDIFTEDSLDPVYRAKARILNDALQEIGMGKYQVSDS
jgi:hypothetical protein